MILLPPCVGVWEQSITGGRGEVGGQRERGGTDTLPHIFSCREAAGARPR